MEDSEGRNPHETIVRGEGDEDQTDSRTDSQTGSTTESEGGVKIERNLLPSNAVYNEQLIGQTDTRVNPTILLQTTVTRLLNEQEKFGLPRPTSPPRNQQQRQRPITPPPSPPPIPVRRSNSPNKKSELGLQFIEKLVEVDAQREGEDKNTVPPRREFDEELGASAAAAASPVASSATVGAHSSVFTANLPSLTTALDNIRLTPIDDFNAEVASRNVPSTSESSRRNLIPVGAEVVRKKPFTSKIDRNRYPSQSPTRTDLLDSRKKNKESTINSILIKQKEQDANIQSLFEKYGEDKERGDEEERSNEEEDERERRLRELRRRRSERSRESRRDNWKDDEEIQQGRNEEDRINLTSIDNQREREE